MKRKRDEKDKKDLPPIKKRKLSETTKKTADELLNLIPIEVALELYNEQLSKATKKGKCHISHLTKFEGQYPRIQIPKK